MIPESFIEELKYQSDIEAVISSYLPLKRRGRNLVGLCPFHSEKTPSFTVYPENGSYYCFGCGSGGDVITFVKQVEHLEYLEALRLLAQRAGMTLPEDTLSDPAGRIKTRILELNREAARFFHKTLLADQGKQARQYLLGRGLSPKTITKFGVGYACESWDSLRGHLAQNGFSREEMLAAAVVAEGKNSSCYDLFRARIIFPIIDLRGNVVGFGGRIMADGKGPKYLNSPDTPVFKKSRNLFALNFAKATKSDRIILAEGYMDVIAIHQGGFDNAVATLGTSLTEEQARLVANYTGRVVVAYDSDNAGQAATRRAINIFGKLSMAVDVLEVTGAKDPDEFLKKYGPQRFAQLLDAGRSAIRFEIDKLRTGKELDTPEGKVAFLNEFCALMAGLQSDIERQVYIGEIARELGLDHSHISGTVQSLRKRNSDRQKRKQSHQLKAYAQDNAVLKRSPRPPDRLAGLVAEEKLICLLLQNPDYYEEVRGKITPEHFSDPDTRQIFDSVSSRLSRGLPAEPIYLAGELSSPLMSRLAALMASARELRFYREQAPEFIRVILEQREQKNPEEVKKMDDEEYRRYIASLKANKK